MIQINFLFTQKGLQQTIDEFIIKSSNRNIKCTLFTGIGVKGIKDEMFACDAVIARGATYSAISTLKKNMPIIELKVTGYDIIRAVDGCKKKFNSRKISIIGCSNMIKGAQVLNDVLDIEIECVSINNEFEAKQAIIKAIATGAQAVIGGFMVGRVAASLNVDYIVIESGQETLETAFKQAIESVLDIQKEQKFKAEVKKKLHRKGLVAKYSFEDIKGHSKVIRNTVSIAKSFSKVDSNIIIEGETGTGKELFAQSIHNASSRCKGPFVAVNCAALSEHLLESELFGYVEGAFTGAAKGGKAGLFELAHSGTIFLDEISEIPIELQAKLLRVLQEKEIRRIGDEHVIPIDVRVIAATNKNLKVMVENKTYRQDLLYRLDVLNLMVPPLRNRVDDILLLIDYFYKNINNQCGLYMCSSAKKLLSHYKWPGNIRELRNFCERLLVLAENHIINIQDVKYALGVADVDENHIENNIAKDLLLNPDTPIIQSFPTIERKAIIGALEKTKNNKSQAARILGIDRSTLWRKIKKLGISS